MQKWEAMMKARIRALWLTILYHDPRTTRAVWEAYYRMLHGKRKSN